MNANSDQSQATGPRVVVIGFGRRLLAALVDGVLVLFLTFVMIVLVSFLALFFDIFIVPYNPDLGLPVAGMMFWFGLFISLIYYIAFWMKSGQTIGKAITGGRVTDANDKELSFGKAFLRYIGYLISGIVFSIGFLWVAFDKKRQGWHDKIAGSYVVRDDDEFADIAAANVEPSDPGQTWIWVVLWLLVGLSPAGLSASLLFLGPVINRTVTDIMQGIFGG